MTRGSKDQSAGIPGTGVSRVGGESSSREDIAADRMDALNRLARLIENSRCHSTPPPRLVAGRSVCRCPGDRERSAFRARYGNDIETDLLVSELRFRDGWGRTRL